MTATTTPGMGDPAMTGRTKEQARSYPGQAHFAGTCVASPSAKCGGCVHLVSRAVAKGLRVGSCELYAKRMKDPTPRKFPIGAMACKYFEPPTRR